MIKLFTRKYEIPERAIDTFWEKLDADTFGTHINPEISYSSMFVHSTKKCFVGIRKKNKFSIYRYKEQRSQFRPDILIKGKMNRSGGKNIIECSYEINISSIISLLFFIFILSFFNNFNYDWISIIVGIGLVAIYLSINFVMGKDELYETEGLFIEKFYKYIE